MTWVAHAPGQEYPGQYLDTPASSVIKHYSKLIFMFITLFAGVHFLLSNTLTTMQMDGRAGISKNGPEWCNIQKLI